VNFTVSAKRSLTHHSRGRRRRRDTSPTKQKAAAPGGGGGLNATVFRSVYHAWGGREFQLADLVLQLQFPSLELGDPERVRGRMRHRVLDFALKRLMFAFKLRHIDLQRHVGPSYPLFPTRRFCHRDFGESKAIVAALPKHLRFLKLALTDSLPHNPRRLRPIANGRDGLAMGSGLSEDEAAEFEQELSRLKQEHRDLDTAIEALERMVAGDQLQIQRLKKRKLILKDRIGFLEDQLTPDIIA
jgi:hypothetical protein